MMASSLSRLGLATLFIGLAAAQRQIGPEENHPPLTTWRCTKAGGCTEVNNFIVLDSLAHNVYQANGGGSCGSWGSPPNETACPTKEACAENCVQEGLDDYSRVGVTTNGGAMTMYQLKDGVQVSPRVYLLDPSKEQYEMMHLTGKEFTFDVDVSKLPCGMNSALYTSEMEADGGKSALNTGGARHGTGYCDAQCYTTPFINGEANIEGYGACCNEMDIWEANSRSAHLAPHPCNQTGVYLCEGEDCAFEGICDKNGCAWNPYRVNQDDFYGRGSGFDVDTTRPFTVITQFPANEAGVLTEIHRLYIQDGHLIRSEVVNNTDLPQVNYLNDEFCAATGSRRFMDLGAHREMGESFDRGVVLAFSIWWDAGGGMRWLDGAPEAGPCNETEGFPENVVKVEPNPVVTFSNIKWGELGSTFKPQSTERHFFHHGAPKPGATKTALRVEYPTAIEREKLDCQWCQIRAFPNHKQYPITIVNEVDDEIIPPNFRFLQHSKLGHGVQAAEDSFRSGCECEDEEECQYAGCLCLQEQEDDSDDEDEARKKAYMYHMHGVKAGLLRSKFLGSTRPIYECHEGCACDVTCPNRVVERGRQVPLQIFRTEKTGWGVRSLLDIRRGQFVDNYIGEIITPQEAQRRRDTSNIAQQKDVYLFALDKFTDEDSPDMRLQGPPLEIDGEFMSGPTRFINHSCEPNLRIFARVGDHADKHIHDLAFFALRDIPRGEQLTFDYVDGVSDDAVDAKDKSKQGDMVPCLCGSKNCRQFLW
ncbi:glycosyl hydrolase family 7 [Colletotrichum costaricense]|uniref:Glucanase n=1 Tax=Colletotrichum costaricense TaxID=1209916 RepID=A0AAJ0E2P0_9PEZI|nr:glycosyl hydrolase family 7 [Colletotrichum costaricense]KAK1532157.1 glycosyl hydrolase family 7 [Colletotrichum costaricense]